MAATIQRKNLGQPDRHLDFEHGDAGLVRVASLSVGRARLTPGWRWSTDVKPNVGSELCEVHHFHVLLAGRFAVRLGDADAMEFVPGDVFDLPPGHDAWVIGDETVELLDISGNVEEFGLPTSPAAVVATILMTDIVESTSTANRLGPTRWRDLLGRHDRIVRAQLDRHRGREIDTTGDGFLAVFDSAVGAVLCGRAIRDAVREIGLEVRAGVHTGEVEERHGEIAGISVHAAARVMAAAGASEVVVSAVTKALAEGRGLSFRELGARELKGFPTPLDLYAVD